MPDQDFIREMEKRLGAITMPRLSTESRERLDERIDGLAAQAELAGQGSHPGFIATHLWKAAAAVALLLGLGLAFSRPARTDGPVALTQIAGGTGIELISSEVTDTIQFEDELEYLSEEGSWPIKTEHYKLVNEVKVRDVSSGLIMTISEPAERVVVSSQEVF